MTRMATIAAICAAFLSGAAAAQAQDAREAEMVGFHQLCSRGDREACVKFGAMLQQNRDRHGEWHRTHPEFFVIER